MPDHPSLTRRIWNRMALLTGLEWLNVATSLITLIGVPALMLGALTTDDKTWVARGLALWLCIATTIFLLLLVVEEFRWHRKARYAEALESLHEVQECIRDAWREYTIAKSLELVNDKLQDAVRHLAHAFSLITGVHCRACIKHLVVHPEAPPPIERALAAQTLVRSEGPTDHDDATDVDWLTDNSDFLVLFRSPNRRFFCGQDLPAMLNDGYQNSHWTQEVIQEERYEYRSALIWPIRKRRPASIDDAESIHPYQDIFGYLCVDSLGRKIYQPRYDFSVGAAVADSLFPLLSAIHLEQTARTVRTVGEPRKDSNGH